VTASPAAVLEREHLYRLFFDSDQLGWCGCGDPDSAYELLRNLLRVMAVPPGAQRASVLSDLLGNDDGRAFTILYSVGRAGLIEHGGHIRGAWLTEKGRRCLALMERHEWEQVTGAYMPHMGGLCPSECPHAVTEARLGPSVASLLRDFEVLVRDEEGVRVEHLRACRWDVLINGCSLGDLLRQASDHAGACTAAPLPARVMA